MSSTAVIVEYGIREHRRGYCCCWFCMTSSSFLLLVLEDVVVLVLVLVLILVLVLVLARVVAVPFVVADSNNRIVAVVGVTYCVEDKK